MLAMLPFMTTSITSETHSVKPLTGYGALVTGGSRGIGRAIAVRLASDGAAVVFTYATERETAEEVVAEIAAQGGWSRTLRLDLAQPEQFPDVFAAADAASAEAGVEGPNVLVANAASFPTRHSTSSVPLIGTGSWLSTPVARS